MTEQKSWRDTHISRPDRIEKRDRQFIHEEANAGRASSTWHGVQLPVRYDISGYRVRSAQEIEAGDVPGFWLRKSRKHRNAFFAVSLEQQAIERAAYPELFTEYRGRKSIGRHFTPKVFESIVEMAANTAECSTSELLALALRKPLREEAEIKRFFDVVVYMAEKAGVNRKSMYGMFSRQQIASIIKRGRSTAPLEDWPEMRGYVRFKTGFGGLTTASNTGETTQRKTEICGRADLSWGQPPASPHSPIQSAEEVDYERSQK